MCMALVAETSVVMYVYGLGGRDLGGHVCVWPWWPRPRWSCMCMALVAETSVVMYVYDLGDSDPGHD